MNAEQLSCCCCGSQKFQEHEILWKELVDEWRLSPYEIDYINRQQGLSCLNCGANLRSIALALAFMKVLNFEGLFLDFVKNGSTRHLKVLEINEAGSLTPWLAQMPGHKLIKYPDYNMMTLPFEAATFDIVIHSDTLEHVEHPTRALSECRRVLKPKAGFCLFTVPIVVDRLTISRTGFPPSYHGRETTQPKDYLVLTEYGCDAWRQVILAGFSECRIISIEFPAAQALVGVN
ncbi:MAG: methyltransferase domain-containing protein [Phormidesmis sp.]